MTVPPGQMNQRDKDYVNNVKNATTQLWFALATLSEAQKQWNALDYGNTLPDDIVPHGDVGAVVFDTTNAINAILAQGHATNLAKLL